MTTQRGRPKKITDPILLKEKRNKDLKFWKNTHIASLKRIREELRRSANLSNSIKSFIEMGNWYEITFRDYALGMSIKILIQDMQVIAKFNKFFLCKNKNGVRCCFKYVDVLCQDIKIKKMEESK